MRHLLLVVVVHRVFHRALARIDRQRLLQVERVLDLRLLVPHLLQERRERGELQLALVVRAGGEVGPQLVRDPVALGDEQLGQLAVEERIDAALLRHGHDLHRQVGNVERERAQRRQRGLALARVQQYEAVDQIVPERVRAVVGGEDQLDPPLRVAEKHLEDDVALARTDARLLQHHRAEYVLDRERVAAEDRHDDAQVGQLVQGEAVLQILERDRVDHAVQRRVDELRLLLGDVELVLVDEDAVQLLRQRLAVRLQLVQRALAVLLVAHEHDVQVVDAVLEVEIVYQQPVEHLVHVLERLPVRVAADQPLALQLERERVVVAVDRLDVQPVHLPVHDVLAVVVAVLVYLVNEIVRDVVQPDHDQVQLQLAILLREPWIREVLVRDQYPLDQRIHAVGERRAVLPDRTVHEAEMLEQHHLPVLVEPVEQLVPQVLLQHVRYFLDVVLRDRTGRFDVFEVIEQIGMLHQQLLEVVLSGLDQLALVVVVDLLAVVLGQRFEALAPHKQDAHLGQLLARRNVAGFFQQLFELLFPSLTLIASAPAAARSCDS
uniref:Secreted protein n=1 Tax=Anopheles quadriannulatus TaxID=34691 RepID=A0A182XS87_ANOQN